MEEGREARQREEGRRHPGAQAVMLPETKDNC